MEYDLLQDVNTFKEVYAVFIYAEQHFDASINARIRKLFMLQDIEFGRTFIQIEVKYCGIKIQFGLLFAGNEAKLVLMCFENKEGYSRYYKYDSYQAIKISYQLNRKYPPADDDDEFLKFKHPNKIQRKNNKYI